MMQQLVHSLYPKNKDLAAPLLAEIKRLGGSTLLPGGGPAFTLIARALGWRLALRLRALAARNPT